MPSPRAVAAGAALVLLALCANPGGAGAPALTGDAAACVAEVNKRVAAVARTFGKEQLRCLKRGAAGKEEHPDACRAGDRRRKAERARDKGERAEAKKCAGAPPPFAYTGVAHGAEVAAAASHATLGDLLGALADDALADKKDDKPGAKCQADVLKRTLQIHDTVWSEAAKAKKKLLGGKSGGAASAQELADAILAALGEGKLAKRQESLASRIEKRCGGHPEVPELFPALFAGSCDAKGFVELGTCAAQRARCHACLGLRRADLLPLDCDAFDDGSANGSCAWPFATNITPQLDEAHAVEATLGAAGGSLETTGADGTVFILDVPADALGEDVEIRMVPVSAIPDLPRGSFLAAVQLLPEGLVFPIAGGATLTLELPAPATDPHAFGWLGDGEDYHLRVAETDGTTWVFDVFHFSGVGGGDGDVGDAGSDYGTSGWETRAYNELEALRDQALEPSVLNAQASEIMRRWLRDGVFLRIGQAERADAFFPLAVAEAMAWLRTAQLMILLDSLWGEGELAPEAAELRERLREVFFTALDRIIQRCEIVGDANAFIDDVLEVEDLALRLQLQPEEDFLSHIRGRCIRVRTSVESLPDDLLPSQSGPLQLRSWWEGPDRSRHYDDPRVYIQIDSAGGTVTPNEGDSDPPQGLFDATVRADDEPPVSIRITVDASLRLVVNGDRFDVWVGEQRDCGWRAGEPPPGSYDRSCTPCSVSGTILECSCRKENGLFVPADIDFSRCDPDEDLANLDGELSCEECP